MVSTEEITVKIRRKRTRTREKKAIIWQIINLVILYMVYIAISSGHTISSIVVLFPELEFPQVMPIRERERGEPGQVSVCNSLATLRAC